MDTPKRSQRIMQEQVTSDGKAAVWIDKQGRKRHIVRCRLCHWQSPGNPRWHGQGSTWVRAMQAWHTHLLDKHGQALPGWDQEAADVAIARDDELRRAEAEKLRRELFGPPPGEG